MDHQRRPTDTPSEQLDTGSAQWRRSRCPSPATSPSSGFCASLTKLFVFGLLVSPSRKGRLTSGRGGQSLRDGASAGCLPVRGRQRNLLPGYDITFVLQLQITYVCVRARTSSGVLCVDTLNVCFLSARRDFTKKQTTICVSELDPQM